jgi:hypothetical protein
MVGLIIFIIALSASIAWLWVGGIDYMMKNHPDYKGEDFFNEEDKNEIL